MAGNKSPDSFDGSPDRRNKSATCFHGSPTCPGVLPGCALAVAGVLSGQGFFRTFAAMKAEDIASLYARHPGVGELVSLVEDSAVHRVACAGLCGSAAAVVVSALSRLVGGRLLLVVMNDEESAGYFYQDAVQMLGGDDVLFFPSVYRRAVKYAQRDAANEILRTGVLGRLGGEPSVRPRMVVTYPDALAERVVARSQLDDRTVRLAKGGMADLTQLQERLLELGFVRRDYVYEPGEFAVRGSILDVYSYSSELPFRIDFFGDEVDSVRTFDVQTQLSDEMCGSVTIVPAVNPGADGLVPFTDLLPADTIAVFDNLLLVRDIVGRIYDEGFARQAISERESLAGSGEEGQGGKLDRDALLVTGEAFLRGVIPLTHIEVGVRPSGQPDATVSFDTSPQPVFHKNFELLRQALDRDKSAGYAVYVCADSTKQHERLQGILGGEDGEPAFIPVEHTLHAGYADHALRACFYTDHQIFDRYHKYSLRSDRARDGKMALTLKELSQFEPGDYVVHVDHGIGRFAGLVRLPGADGQVQEVIKLVYRNDDVVFVSIHALHKVSKYKGKEGEPPRLSGLGTGAWEKMKERTKKKIKDIARDLIRLYSRRREERGHAFSPDSFLQRELEAGFAYEDTPDQLRVTQEVKADMERARPMDRLVCGDVGFGKTEIAVRAAFKAACDNKQVAVLVPTTVLALQHYNTFVRRLHGFPVRVDYLSRARTPAQTKALLKDLADGKIDIIIGTHKLIGRNVKFKDLGLLIVDEEQKFGVAVKEKLRQLKVNVDTLTMSATPIPRTLQFSLMGARDLSVIQTPPPNRRPIQTEVHTFGHEIIADAVNFELSRNGQVFIVSNRISSLPNLAGLLHKYVPDARVAIGHGQMSPDELERVIVGFINHDCDVLVSTTIVENGIDIPNANTIIIDAAHTFGLSDLHQMRGRVGRGNRKAFCYLLAPPLAMLPDESRRRLQAIESFSDLGSGIHIAMQDLDIRGAGNLLGAEQSGFVADLGYETYQKILSEAVTELKNEEFAEVYADEIRQSAELRGDLFVDECNVETDAKAFFPETYVPGSGERMALYRELDALESDEQVEAYRQRLADRFGPVPPEGEELLGIVPLRRDGRRLGVERLLLKNGRLTLYFVSRPDSPFYASPVFGRVISYAVSHVRTCELGEANGKRRMRVSGVASVAAARAVLADIMAMPAN